MHSFSCIVGVQKHLAVSDEPSSTQIIPTVGVNSDTDGKAAGAQMKHFTKLIDSTASKARFLSSFTKQARPERACIPMRMLK